MLADLFPKAQARVRPKTRGSLFPEEILTTRGEVQAEEARLPPDPLDQPWCPIPLPTHARTPDTFARSQSPEAGEHRGSRYYNRQASRPLQRKLLAPPRRARRPAHSPPACGVPVKATVQ